MSASGTLDTTRAPKLESPALAVSSAWDTVPIGALRLAFSPPSCLCSNVTFSEAFLDPITDRAGPAHLPFRTPLPCVLCLHRDFHHVTNDIFHSFICLSLARPYALTAGICRFPCAWDSVSHGGRNACHSCGGDRAPSLWEAGTPCSRADSTPQGCSHWRGSCCPLSPSKAQVLAVTLLLAVAGFPRALPSHILLSSNCSGFTLRGRNLQLRLSPLSFDQHSQ